MCFQILGFDILIDSKYKPYLLEVNASPSFGTDSSLDYKIKKNVIGDAFRMLNFNYAKRQQVIKERTEQIKSRILTGKNVKMTPEEREIKRQSLLQKRFKFESTRMRGYELIYPSSDKQRNQKYEQQI